MSNFESIVTFLYATVCEQVPSGVYLSLTPGEPSTWTGVIFPRQGPYQGAVLRFIIKFGQLLPPSATFGTEIFHPLITPSILNTSSPDSQVQNQTASSFEENRSLPGAFSLKHGFPEYHNRKRDTRYMTADFCFALLLYIKCSFEEVSVLDSIPLECAGDRTAWYAWRAHRGLPLAPQELLRDESKVPNGRAKRSDQWDWSGIWQGRAMRTVVDSGSDSSLYASSSYSPFRFSKLKNGDAEFVKHALGAPV